jgi:hypothetical protein
VLSASVETSSAAALEATVGDLSTKLRWAFGLVAIVLIALLFYSLRVEQPRIEAAGSNIEPVASPQSVAAPKGQDLSPVAATKVPRMPDFVDLVETVKPAVVSVRVKSASRRA